MSREKIDIGQIRKNLAAIDEEFKPVFARLKPVFGDPQMIQLRDDMSSLAEMEREMKVKLDNAKGGQKLSEEIITKKKNIMWLIGEIEKKQNATPREVPNN